MQLAVMEKQVLYMMETSITASHMMVTFLNYRNKEVTFW